MKKTLLLLFLPSLLMADPKVCAKRVSAHLLLDDARGAVEEAKKGLQDHPDAKNLQIALIRALCARGDEVEALEKWKETTATHKELLQDRTALETLAWGVLNKGENSDQLSIKVTSLLGAALTRDAKALPLLVKELRGSNAQVRAAAVSLAAAFGDIPLQEEMFRLLKEEKVWYVRLEVIRAVGQLRMTIAKDELKRIIGHPQTMAEEKVAAIVALVNMYESIEDEELTSLLKSDRAGLRELACNAILFLELHEKLPLLLSLLSDRHPTVRASALHALTQLGVKEIEGKPLMEIETVWRRLEDRAPEVSILAARLSLIHGEKRGAEKLVYWLKKGEKKWQRAASSAVASSGSKGIRLAKEWIIKSRDPFVRMNLALGLIGQRESMDLAGNTLAEGLHLDEERLWMWDHGVGGTRSLSPSTVTHVPQVPNYPQVVDQMTRLELLSILCVIGYPKAQEAVKHFLQSHNWGATGAAASTLISEGDEEAFEVVRSLLDDKEDKVRIQAAMILTMLGGDEKAVDVLIKAYGPAGREMKIRILESLIQAKSPSILPFLLGVLDEPFQILRVIAASAIIQCLYS